MSTRTSRFAVQAAAAIVLVVMVGGCAGQTSKPPAAAPATTTTVAPTTTIVPPMTDKELAWLHAISAMNQDVEKSMLGTTDITAPSPAEMATLGKALRSCTQTLVKGGSPSDRLQPVFALVTKACKEYDKGAACFATVAKIDVRNAVSPAEFDKWSKAFDCGLAASSNGMTLLTDAEMMGAKIKETG
jgi:hypothetical protein